VKKAEEKSETRVIRCIFCVFVFFRGQIRLFWRSGSLTFHQKFFDRFPFPFFKLLISHASGRQQLTGLHSCRLD
jgi:hypothetical protein